MNTLAYVWAVTWKELKVLATDRSALAIYFLLPLLLSSVQGAANVTLTPTDGQASILLQVGLINEDQGEFGREVAAAIGTIDELDVEGFDSLSQGEEQVALGNLAALIHLPEDFSENINAYQPTTLDVIVDPAQPESASIVTGIMNQVVDEVTIWGEIQYGIRKVFEDSGVLEGATPEQGRAVQAQNLGVIMTRLGEMRRSPQISVVSENLAGDDVETWLSYYLSYIFAGFTVMFIFFVVGLSAEGILREREAGTLRRLVAAPIPRGAIIAGKLFAYMLIPCLQAIFLFGVAVIFFDVTLGDSPLGLVVHTVVVAATATTLGLLIATLAKSSNQAASMGLAAGFILAIMGGVVPIGSQPFTRMDGFISILARITPQAHALEGYMGLIADDASFLQILPETGIVFAMGLVFFLIAMWRFKFEA